MGKMSTRLSRHAKHKMNIMSLAWQSRIFHLSHAMITEANRPPGKLTLYSTAELLYECPSRILQQEPVVGNSKIS